MKSNAYDRFAAYVFRPDQMGIYIHWPFCAAKCPYCDFNSHVRGGVDQARYLAAYQKSIAHYAALLRDREVVSIFFGGGTPSLMQPQIVAGIIDAVQKHWRVVNDLEVTLEANPTSVEADKFADFKAAGVNRVSLGIQAMNDADLKFLGREHDAMGGIRAIETAGAQFERYSFDLIYGRPNQSLKDWEGELTKALRHARGHMSLYQLTIEQGTPFYMRYHRGEFAIPDDVGGAEFYHLTQDIMEGAGMPAYEVSNHAEVGAQCRHNMVYWKYADYVGIGAGAHGRFVVGDGVKIATREHAALEIWLKRVEEKGHGAHPYETITPQDRFAESLMMGLRLRDGVDVRAIEKASGCAASDMLDLERVQIAQSEGWIEKTEQTLRLTREGMLRLNALLPYILRT